jgi:hypothetical protein
VAAPRSAFGYGTFDRDGSTILVTEEPGPDLVDVMHPTAAMMRQIDLIRAEAQRSMEEEGGVPPLVFLTLVFADAFTGAREILSRFVDGDPMAYELAETYLALGFRGHAEDRPVESLRLNVASVLDEVDDDEAADATSEDPVNPRSTRSDDPTDSNRPDWLREENP